MAALANEGLTQGAASVGSLSLFVHIRHPVGLKYLQLAIVVAVAVHLPSVPIKKPDKQARQTPGEEYRAQFST